MKRFLLGIVAGTSSLGLYLLAHLMLGVITGVVAICGSASEWWAQTYLYLTVWVLPACLITAVRFSRRAPGIFYRKNVISWLRVAGMIILAIIGNGFVLACVLDLADG